MKKVISVILSILPKASNCSRSFGSSDKKVPRYTNGTKAEQERLN
jgi:hypothetical protein